MTKVDDRSVVCYVVGLRCGGRRTELDTAALVGAIARGSDCTSLWSIDTMVRPARATHYVRPQLLAGAEGHTRGSEGGLPYQVLLAEGLNPLAFRLQKTGLEGRESSWLGARTGPQPRGLTPPGAETSQGSALDRRSPADSRRCGHCRPQPDRFGPAARRWARRPRSTALPRGRDHRFAASP
jgi:hypothetical protein